MQQFIEKYAEQINGVLTGFDRLVFRGSLWRLNYGRYDSSLKAMVATGMEEYLWQNKILFKNYQDYVKRVSERLKKATLEPFEKQKIPVIFLRNPSADKNQVAREIASEKGVTSGLVCAISTLEPSPTFEHRGTHIIRRTRPCHVLYQYQIHPELGWMSTTSAAAWLNLSWIRLTVNLRLWSQNSDLVSLQYSGSAERAGMAGQANEPGRIEVRAAGELFCLAGGLSAGAGVDEPAGGEELGGSAERFRRAIESRA
jgi:hypothetical protein